MGTCGISHRWSSSRDDWSRSRSSNNSDIEDLRRVIVLLFFRSLTAFPHNSTHMLLDDWTSAAMVVSHLAAVHPPSISPGSKTPTCNKQEISPTAVYPRCGTQVARVLTPILLQCEHYDERIVAGSGVTVSPLCSRDGCDMQPLRVRPPHSPA